MNATVTHIGLGLSCALATMGCMSVSEPTAAGVGSYGPVETRLLDGDLVNFLVSYTGENGATQVADYAECAAAQYTRIRGFGFARHLRTNVTEVTGTWRADAVYTISPALPDGLRTLDAEVVLANCRDNEIPTV